MRTYTPMLTICLALLAALAMTGCRGETADAPPRQFFPDLDDQLKYKAQDESGFFADGRTMREPPANTVAWGRTAHTGDVTGYTPSGRAVTADFAQREELLRADSRFVTGTNADGTFVEDMPVTVTTDFIEVGRENYNIYCIVCHGGLGEGDGMVGEKWAYDLPSLQAEIVLKGGSEDKGSDGYLYDRIRNGVPNPSGAYPYLMPPYANKVSEYESWAIVAYIRTLQKARHGEFEELPDRMQLQMNRSASADEPLDGAMTDADAEGEEASS